MEEPTHKQFKPLIHFITSIVAVVNIRSSMVRLTKKGMRSRSSAIIASATLLITPLSAFAFQSGPSSPIITTTAVSNTLPTNSKSFCRPRSATPFNASVLKDSLDAADETVSPFLGNNNNNNIDASDILNQAVSNVNGVNGVDLVNGVSTTNGVDLNGSSLDTNGAVELEKQKVRLDKQMHRTPTPPNYRPTKKQQKQINKSRRNNKAMEDPEFLRKRTDTLLRRTEDGGYDDNHFASVLSGAGSLKVDKRTFDWLIDAWSYSGEYDATDYALSLLSRMEELRDMNMETGTAPIVSPDVKSYTKVINAISRSGREDAGEQAESLLERMIEDGMHPNAYTYTYVIDAYARSHSPKAPHAAQRLVDEMERLRSEGDPDVWPTTRAWNSVIASWSQWKGEEMVSIRLSLANLAYKYVLYMPCLYLVLVISLHRHGDISGLVRNVQKPVWT